MKQKLLLKSLLLLFALIAGTSSVWAVSKTYKHVLAASELNGVANDQKSKSLSDANGNITTGVTWSVAPTWKSTAANGQNVDATKGQQYGTGSLPVTSLVFSTTYDFGTITSVKVNASTANSATATIAVQVGTTAFKINTNETVSLTNSAADYDFTGSATGNITITLSQPSTSKALYVKSLEVTYDDGTEAKVATPSISGAQHFLTSTQVTIECTTDGAAIQYSTDNGANWSNYSTPFTLNTTTTVKAKATKSGSTDSEVASMTFTKVTPTTVTAAITAIGNLADNGTIADQCVAGIISQIDYYGDNAITYWISDDGTMTNQLEVFKGKGLNGANFSAKTDMNVGDEVTVFGTLQKYVKNETTTPEFIAGSKLLKYEATGTPAPIINASNVTIDSEATSGEITYTIDNPTGASLTAAEKQEYDWISNVTVTASKVTFTTTVNTGAQRVGYITLSYEGAQSKDVKITQSATYGTASLPFAFDSGKSDIETTAGLTHTGLGTDYDYSPKLKFDNTGDYLILKINGAAQKLYFDIKGNSFSGGTFKVQTSVDGVAYTDLESYATLSAVSHEVLDLTSTVRYIKWIYTTKSNGNVALGRIGVDCEAAYIPSAGYATYTTPNIVDFAGTGVTAYKVSAVNANSITLEEVTKAPADVPLVLNAAAGNYCLNVIASADEVTGNELLVSTGSATTDENNTVYALASKGEPAVTGFYKVKAGVKVPAGKAYLKVAVANPAPEFLGFGGEATGVNDVRSKMADVRGEVYNLAGQRVAQPTKGLYIVNGKKVIIK
jgi:hypothetical protein